MPSSCLAFHVLYFPKSQEYHSHGNLLTSSSARSRCRQYFSLRSTATALGVPLGVGVCSLVLPNNFAYPRCSQPDSGDSPPWEGREPLGSYLIRHCNCWHHTQGVSPSIYKTSLLPSLKCPPYSLASKFHIL